MVITNTCFTN